MGLVHSVLSYCFVFFVFLLFLPPTRHCYALPGGAPMNPAVGGGATGTRTP